MTTRSRLLSLLMVAGVVAVTGCGPKRPPVVRNPPPPDAASTAGRDARTGTGNERVDDSGPGIQPFVDNSPSATDQLSRDESSPLADIHFSYNERSLTEESRAALDGHATWLKQHGQTKVIIQGHCDERGTSEYNLALGEQRARAAREYLMNQGIAADRLSTVSFGKEKPIDTASNEAAWAKNRRDHFAVSN